MDNLKPQKNRSEIDIFTYMYRAIMKARTRSDGTLSDAVFGPGIRQTMHAAKRILEEHEESKVKHFVDVSEKIDAVSARHWLRQCIIKQGSQQGFARQILDELAAKERENSELRVKLANQFGRKIA